MAGKIICSSGVDTLIDCKLWPSGHAKSHIFLEVGLLSRIEDKKLLLAFFLASSSWLA